MPSLSSGQLGHKKGVWKLPLKPPGSVPCCHFLVLRGQQTAMQDLTHSVEDIAPNNKKKSHRCFYSPEEANRVRHSTIMATYAISSASYPPDQQKSLMKPSVSVFFPCLSYSVSIGYFLKKVVFHKAWPRNLSISQWKNWLVFFVLKLEWRCPWVPYTEANFKCLL